MANSNLVTLGGLTVATTYAFKVIDYRGYYWNTSGTPAFEAYNAAHIANYANGAATPNANGRYAQAFPSAIVAGDYIVELCSRAGGSLATTDPAVAESDVHWDGATFQGPGNVYVAPAGLNNIPLSYPSGRAANFTQMLVQLYRRFFNKTVYDSVGNTIKTYANDDTTVVTTQTTSDASGVQTVGDA